VDLVFLGGEVPSHRKLLIEAGVKHIGINYWRLTKRGLPKTKDYLLSEKYPDDIRIYVDGGGYQVNKEKSLSIAELEDFAADYEDWVAINEDKIFMATELDANALGSSWIKNERDTFWEDFGVERFMPVWHKESGHAELMALSQMYEHIAIPGDTINTDLTLASRVKALQSQHGVEFHGLACANPDNLRQVPLRTASTLSWLSPMMRGETIIWDGTKLVRYQKKMKDQARPRYKSIIEKAGLDFQLILEDDSNEVTKLAIWSYLQLEQSITKGKTPLLSDRKPFMDDPGLAETQGVDPDNRGVEVRKPSSPIEGRNPEEMRVLPVFSLSTKTVIEQDATGRDVIVDASILSSGGTSLRQCNTCFVAANCPAFKPDNMCAFNLPVEVKTKDQLKSLLNAIIEMQAARVGFARFAEELNGGYPDPNTGQEIDRLFKITKQLKELEENKEFVRMTVERQTSGGVMSALFGDRASTLHELPNNGFSEEQTTKIIADNLEK
jgi:hypothetical protein